MVHPCEHDLIANHSFGNCTMLYTCVLRDSTVKLLDVRAGCNRKKHKVSPGLSVQVSAGNFLGYPTSCGQATVLTKAVVCFQQSLAPRSVRIIMKSQVFLISLHHPSKYFNTHSRRFQLCNKELLHYMHISL